MNIALRERMNISALLMCLAVVMMFSAETPNAYLKRDLHDEQTNSTCALTEEELDEVMGGLEALEEMVKQVKSVIGDM